MKCNVYDYDTAKAWLNGRTKKNLPKKATYLEEINGIIYLFYQRTAVVTYYSNGATEFYANGWYTNTTKSRMNEFSNVHVYQHKHTWYVKANDTWEFFDCIRIDKDGNKCPNIYGKMERN